MKLQQLLSYTRKALDDYHMIEEGDKIAIGISGGKDSLTLLYALSGLKRFYPKKYEIEAITVDMGFKELDFSAVAQLCKELDTNYTVVESEIAEIVFEHRKESNPCSLCAKMRKGAFNAKAKELGCNKEAYAHHYDDVIETLLMSLIYEGRIHCFSPATYLDRSDITLIRPMIYVEESDIIKFNKAYQLPVVKNPCPVDGHTTTGVCQAIDQNIGRRKPWTKGAPFSCGFDKPYKGMGIITVIIEMQKGDKGMNEKSYHDQVDIENTERLRKIQEELPRFCKQYFRGIEPNTSSRTRIAYAYDLRVFFEFLKNSNPALRNTDIREFKVDILDQIKAVDIEEYLEYLSYYKTDETERLNKENGKKRKLVSLRSFYNYYFKKEMIKTNPASLISVPKLHEKAIIRLEPDEVVKLLDEVENAQNMTETQQKFHEKTKIRDLALMTLLLGTGIRVSECIGLDISDVDFDNNGIKIHRKGGYEAVIYFGDEVQKAMLSYLKERNQIVPVEGNENALFLSLQQKRISVRSVENLVKKYASTVTKLKKITPHKLRSTYGTSLYRETGDIYLVADVLGHKDVNTTKKHYAAIEDERRRKAAKVVKLRESR